MMCRKGQVTVAAALLLPVALLGFGLCFDLFRGSAAMMYLISSSQASAQAAAHYGYDRQYYMDTGKHRLTIEGVKKGVDAIKDAQNAANNVCQLGYNRITMNEDDKDADIVIRQSKVAVKVRLRCVMPLTFLKSIAGNSIEIDYTSESAVKRAFNNE